MIGTRLRPMSHRGFWALFAAGLLFRVFMLTQTTTLGPMIVDEQHYVQLATTLVEHGVYGMEPSQPTSKRPPLFPGMVAALWTVTGVGDLQLVRVLNLLLSIVTARLVYLLGRDLFDEGAGLLASAAFWLYPSLIFFSFTILTETLFTLLFVGCILLLVRLVRDPAMGTAVAAGALMGGAALTRSVVWPFPLVLGPVLMVLAPGRLTSRVTLATLLLAGHVAVLTPWAVRNTRLQGVGTVVDTMGGRNLRMGNYEHTPDDRMWDAVQLTGDKNWAWALREEFPEGTHLTEGQMDKWAQRQAIRYILAHPGITARRMVIKVSDFFGLEREYAAGIREGLYGPPVWFGVTATSMIVIGYVALIVTGMAGLWLAPLGWRERVIVVLPLLGILGGHALAFGHSRYHIPLMPVFGVFAAALVSGGWRALRQSAVWQRVGAGTCVAALMAIWIYQVLVVDAARIRGLVLQVLGS